MATKKILTDGLTNKQRIMRMVERFDDDITFEQALDRMYVMKEIMEGIKEAEAGLGVDHDELFDELERLCDEEVAQTHLAAEGAKISEGARSSHRRSRASGKRRSRS